MLLRMSGRSKNGLTRDMSGDGGATGVSPKRGMVLPFTPLAMSFDEVNYYVDMPAVSSLILLYPNLFPVTSQFIIHVGIVTLLVTIFIPFIAHLAMKREEQQLSFSRKKSTTYIPREMIESISIDRK